MEHRPAARTQVTRTKEFAQESVLADGKSGVWVAGLVQYATGSGADVKNYLLDWTGKKWHVYSSPEPLGAITSDGHGGPPTSSVRRQWRPSCTFHGGRWQQDEIPVPETSAHDPLVRHVSDHADAEVRFHLGSRGLRGSPVERDHLPIRRLTPT
jgi:hypothetical protein